MRKEELEKRLSEQDRCSDEDSDRGSGPPAWLVGVSSVSDLAKSNAKVGTYFASICP